MSLATASAFTGTPAGVNPAVESYASEFSVLDAVDYAVFSAIGEVEAFLGVEILTSGSVTVE